MLCIVPHFPSLRPVSSLRERTELKHPACSTQSTQNGSLLLEPAACAQTDLQPCLWWTCPALLSYRHRHQKEGPEASCRLSKEDLTVPEDWLRFHAPSMGLMSVSTPGYAELYGRDSPLTAFSSYVEGAAGRELYCCEKWGDLSQKWSVLSKKAWPLDHNIRMKQLFPAQNDYWVGNVCQPWDERGFLPAHSLTHWFWYSQEWLAMICFCLQLCIFSGKSTQMTKINKYLKLRTYFAVSELSQPMCYTLLFLILPQLGQEKGHKGCLSPFLIIASLFWPSCTIKSYIQWSLGFEFCTPAI